MLNTIETWLVGQQIAAPLARLLAVAGVVALLLLLAGLSLWAGRRFLLPLFAAAVKHSSSKWDDTLDHHRFFRRLVGLLPAVVTYLAIDTLLPTVHPAAIVLKRITLILFVIQSVRLLRALFKAVQEISQNFEAARGKPIRGYLQALTIVVYVMAGIFIVAIATDKSPWGILTVFGGLTAVLILVFKDTLLGLVAGVQLSANDLVRVGDWIEMPKYGADGDVIDITINTIKVRNWDKTIASIPTYALVSDSFKNWRGMQESGGRRIKRAIHIDMASIRFCDGAMLDRLQKIGLLRDYLEKKGQEIASYNAEHQVDTSLVLNGRQQTNIGVFRAYVVAYLRQHPQIHQQMTFLVRHLQPTAQGLPLEIYVFSRDQVWANYEAIQADIFDHLLAAVGLFDLRVFQYPTGHDLQSLGLASRMNMPGGAQP